MRLHYSYQHGDATDVRVLQRQSMVMSCEVHVPWSFQVVLSRRKAVKLRMASSGRPARRRSTTGAPNRPPSSTAHELSWSPLTRKKILPSHSVHFPAGSASRRFPASRLAFCREIVHDDGPAPGAREKTTPPPGEIFVASDEPGSQSAVRSRSSASRDTVAVAGATRATARRRRARTASGRVAGGIEDGAMVTVEKCGVWRRRRSSSAGGSGAGTTSALAAGR